MSSVAVRNRVGHADEAEWTYFEDVLPRPMGNEPWIERIDEEALVASNPVVVAINRRVRRGAAPEADLLSGYVPDDSAPELTDAVARSVHAPDLD